MITITVPEQHHEFFNEEDGKFYYIDLDHDVSLELEHSLISLRKWEGKTHKPFIKTENKTAEEVLEYIKCMTMNKIREKDKIAYDLLTEENLQKIKEYIDDPMTATWFSNGQKKSSMSSREAVTAEIIYYWMIALNIPVEFERWHLNRLITLIKVVSIKSNTKPEKVNKRDAARERAALNAKRRAMYKTKG